MDNDARDRREQPEPEPGETPDPGTDDQLTPRADSEAASEPAAPPADPRGADEPAESVAGAADADVAEEPSVSAADIESWPSQDVAPSRPTEAPVAESAAVEAWPTEPPAAGSAPADAWPTEPPEIGDEPILAPEPTEPPPSEVEAYPAPSSWTEPIRTADAEGTEPAPESAAAEPEADLGVQPELAAAAVAGGATAESTLCPRCGTENQPGLSFCRNCGQRLVAAGVASTVERPAVPEGTMACPRCGTHNRAGVAFCQNCGANLRGTSAGYVPPAVADEAARAPAAEARGGAVLGPVVLLIGIVGIVTAWLLPFAFGTGSLFDRAFGSGGYGAAFWSAYPEGGLSDQAYFGLTAAAPILAGILLILAVAGFLKARPGPAQTAGLVIALLWSVGMVVLFLIVELAGNWDGDIVGLLRLLTPAGIIFMLASLIVLIGTLTRFGRS